MFKNHLFHGIAAGLVSGLACYFFYSTLRDEFMYDFSTIFTTMNLFAACMFGCVLASVGFFAAKKIMPKYGEIVFNFIFTTLVFASLISPMMHKLPLDFDEYLTVIFPTFAMTLHFFPAIFWFALKPLFIRK